MKANDFKLGLEDAAEFCEGKDPITLKVTENGRCIETVLTSNRERAIQACREAIQACRKAVKLMKACESVLASWDKNGHASATAIEQMRKILGK